MRVLVVDDEIDSREMLSELLRVEGYDVVEAENGKVGLEMLAHGWVDLIVTDVMMPVMAGDQMLAEVQRDPELRAIPVIVMSAGDGARVARRFRSAFLAKPLDIGALLALARKLLHRR